MNKITFPLIREAKGPQVADLHGALQALLDRALILANDEGTRLKTAEELKRDVKELTYGEATAKLITIFQKESGLREASGDVDGPTANALNQLLHKSGLLNEERPSSVRWVTGLVRREDSLPLRDAHVRVAHVADSLEIRLGEDIADAEGRYTIRYDALPGTRAVNLKVSVIDQDGRTVAASPLVPEAKPVETIDLTVSITAPPADRQTIEGAILLEHGQPADKLKLRLYRRDFGGKATLLEETTTVGDGRYAFSFDAKNRAASLEVRAVKQDGSEEVTLSKPLNDLTAESRAHLNFLAPKSLQPVASEYRRLATDLAQHVTDIRNLKDAKEDAQQQDLTVLNRATGWDARLIALASITERFAADPDVGLSSEELYGLLRAGLPSDKLMLAQVEPDVVEMSIKKVRDAGVVEIDDAGIEALKTKFTAFANKTRLAMPVPGSRSTYGQLMDASGAFANDAPGQEAKQKFASVFLRHRGDGARLWDLARREGLDGRQVGRL